MRSLPSDHWDGWPFSVLVHRNHVHVSGPWHGGRVEQLEGETAVIVVQGGAGVRRYRGPVRALPCAVVAAPLVVRLSANERRVLEVQGSTFASGADARRAESGEPGIVAVVPFALRGESPVLRRVAGGVSIAGGDP